MYVIQPAATPENYYYKKLNMGFTKLHKQQKASYQLSTEKLVRAGDDCLWTLMLFSDKCINL